MKSFGRRLTQELTAEFVKAVHSREPVTGHTHPFYRYPARFSPLFARAAIKMFTQPGDLILDPFMGGGTTLVEARVQGRHSVGVDISSLSNFIAQVKTTVLSEDDIRAILSWSKHLQTYLHCHKPSERPEKWIRGGYQRNITGKTTWPVRKLLEQAIAYASQLVDKRLENFARCALLKTGQWALDCRKEIPSAEDFRRQLTVNITEMCEQARQFSSLIRAMDLDHRNAAPIEVHCVKKSAKEIKKELVFDRLGAPRLILTSPPYPGVHVVYHRWQIHGRKETPAPFWIANCMDGRGASFYTMGDRRKPGLSTYFSQLFETFSALAQVSDSSTLLIQMLAFSEPSCQFPRYLDVMKQAGFVEDRSDSLANSPDGRI